MDISAAEFLKRLDVDLSFKILDVRETIEYHTFNIGGLNIPLGVILNDFEEGELSADEEIIVICQHGVRSRTAVRFLSDQGYTRVHNLKGGLMALQKLKSNTLTK